MAPINTQTAKHAMMYYFYILLCLSKQNQNQNKKQNRKNKGRSDIHLLPLGCLNFPIKNHYVTLEKRHGTPQYTEFFSKPLFQLSYKIKCHDLVRWCEITFSKWSRTAISYTTEILSDALSGKPHQC